MAISGILSSQNHYNQRASGFWPTSFYVAIVAQKAIFGYGGNSSGRVSITNLVSNTGIVATDTTGVGTARRILAAAAYGGDKAIFGFGSPPDGPPYHSSITNLVSNTGVVASDTAGVGGPKSALAAAGYGGDKAIFGFGQNSEPPTYLVSATNLVSNTGVVSNDVTGVGTARHYLAAAGYGGDKAIFGYGEGQSITNLVSNTGVVATNTTGVGTARYGLAAAKYGGDKALFGYGIAAGASRVSVTNLVSNTGVVSSDTTGVGTARGELAAAGYDTNKAIFGYGDDGNGYVSMTNLVSNTGTVASDVTGVGTARYQLAASSYAA